MFTSEEQIVESLLAARQQESSGPKSLGQKFVSLFGKRGYDRIPEPVARRLAAVAKPCISLETSAVEDEAVIPLGATKIGSRPDLPADVGWPIRPPYPDVKKRGEDHRKYVDVSNNLSAQHVGEGHEAYLRDYTQMIEVVQNPFPLEFIAQINFEEMWAAGPLGPDMPKSGLLSIFYDTLEQPWGFVPTDHVGWVCLFRDEGSGSLIRFDTPRELSKVDRHLPLAPLACDPCPCLTPLPLDSATFENLQLSSELRDIYFDWWLAMEDADCDEGANRLHHRVVGWPFVIQNDMQAECALVAAGYYCGDAEPYTAADTANVRATATEWLLLAQIDSEENNGLMWGDTGSLYLWIRRDDLVARRFEAARIILQCY